MMKSMRNRLVFIGLMKEAMMKSSLFSNISEDQMMITLEAITLHREVKVHMSPCPHLWARFVASRRRRLMCCISAQTFLINTISSLVTFNALNPSDQDPLVKFSRWTSKLLKKAVISFKELILFRVFTKTRRWRLKDIEPRLDSSNRRLKCFVEKCQY